MPVVPVNYFAILACAAASMVIGALWYGPFFGKMWLAWSGINMNQAKKESMTKLYMIQLVGSAVMAFVLQHSLVFASSYLGASGYSAGLMAGFWSWLGFIAPVTLGVVLWEGKPWKLWILNNAYYLVVLCVMGTILVLWK